VTNSLSYAGPVLAGSHLAFVYTYISISGATLLSPLLLLLPPPLLLQVQQYDTYLRGYQAAAIQTERLAALLNAGQSVILAAGRHQ
jgi:hypothetical protein